MTFLPEEKYKICLESVPIVSADVLILSQSFEKILLFKRNNRPLRGVFYTIGGRILKNESIIGTATRKLVEEAGINVTREDLFWGGITEEFHEGSVFKNVDTHSVDIFYGYIAPSDIEISIDSQHSQYRWFDIRSNDFHPHIAKKLDILLNNNSQIYNSEIVKVQG